MTNLTLIAAIGENNELGKDNKLLWYLPEDLAFFKEQTLNKPIVMGIKTLNSLPKLLPNRKHIVLTHQNIELAKEIEVFHTKEDLLTYISTLNQEVMVIGGASIYSQFLEFADKMILTKISTTAPADCYFPTFNEQEWTKEVLSENKYNDINYKHLVYRRKNNSK